MIATLVIIHWNTPKELKKLLKLVAHDREFHVLVVDNNSDEPVDWITKDFPAVHLIQNSINRGYSFACNQGIQESKGEWVFFLNPDVFITPESVHRMIRYAHSENLDAVSPKPHSSDYMKPLATPFTFLTEFTPLVRIIPKWFISDLVDQFTLFGGCLGVRKWIIEDLGGWDERFFVWFEDVDLTKQLYKAGYKVGWAPVSFEHKGGTSFQLLDTQLRRNIFFNEMLVYGDKHFGQTGGLIVKMLQKRFRVTKFLPEIQSGISLTIPNVKKELLDRFLERNTAYLERIEHCIVVTSAVTPEKIWAYRKKHPSIRFVLLQKNRGFAHTVNVGFRVSPTQWVGTVNDDVVLNKDWLENCLVSAPADTGSINPVICSDSAGQKIESAGISVLDKGKALPIKNVSNEVFSRVDATNGAAVIYKNKALQKSGLFDEKFGSYLEDIDLSLRLSRNGYFNYVNTRAHIEHTGHSSARFLGKKKQFYDFRNWILLIAKNWPASKLFRHLPSIMVERLRNISGMMKA